MIVDHLMTRDTETCTPDANLAHAAMIMWRRDCGIVPVLERPEGRLIGLITDRDICMATATQHLQPDSIAVESIMNRTIFSCSPTDSVRVALHKMAEYQVRRLPVVDKEGRLQGIVSLNDLILAAERNGRGAEELLSYTDVVGTLKAVSAHRLPVAVLVT